MKNAVSHLTRFRRLALALVISLALPVFAADAPPRSAPAAWTILFYGDADCNLESSMIDNLNDMIAAQSATRVNLVMLLDRARNDDPDEGYSGDEVGGLENWHSGKLIIVQPGRLVEVADWGPVNMAAGATLGRFLDWGIAAFPAARYAVVVSDHGAAWQGACSDDEDESESLIPLAAIHDALKPAAGRISGFELIGFDACLMAHLEVAQSVADCGRYLVASEELEPGDGWDWKAIGSALARQPDLDGAALGRVIVSTFQEHFEKSEDEETRNRGAGATLSLVDLRRVAAVQKSVEDCAAALAVSLDEGGHDNWMRIARAHNRAEGYGVSGDPASPGAEVYDLADLAKQLQREYSSGPVATAAAALETAVQAAVLFARRGEARPAARGLSIYFPRSRSSEENLAGYQRLPFAFTAAWGGFLARYLGFSTNDRSGPLLKPIELSSSTLDLAKDEKVEIVSAITTPDVSEAWFILSCLMDSDEVIIGQMPIAVGPEGDLAEEWNGGWFTLVDSEKNEFICPVTEMEDVDEEGNVFYLSVPLEYRPAGRAAWTRVTVKFLVRLRDEGLEGRPVMVFKETEEGPTPMTIDRPGVFRPLFVMIDAEGEESLVASDESEDFLHVKRLGDLQVDYQLLEPGDYAVGFLVYDFAGNGASEMAKVTVKE